MDRNTIMIGSICVLVILIFLPLTSVIGFQSTTNKIVKTSPLFNIRTQRAICKEFWDLESDYIGKEKEIDIPLPRINHVENTEKSLYTVTCGTETIHPQCCHTMVYWACDITTSPFCQYITTGPLCQYITTGPICNWISFQQSCAPKDSSG